MPPTPSPSSSSSSYPPPAVRKIEAEETARPQQSCNVLTSTGPSVPTTVHQVNSVLPTYITLGGVQYCVMPPPPCEVALPAATTGDTSAHGQLDQGDMSAYGQRNPGPSLPQTTSAARQPAMVDHDACKKRELRLQKNKECARMCRLKRKDRENLLQSHVEQLKAKNKKLVDRVRHLEAFCAVISPFLSVIRGPPGVENGPLCLRGLYR